MTDPLRFNCAPNYKVVVSSGGLLLGELRLSPAQWEELRSLLEMGASEGAGSVITISPDAEERRFA